MRFAKLLALIFFLLPMLVKAEEDPDPTLAFLATAFNAKMTSIYTGCGHPAPGASFTGKITEAAAASDTAKSVGDSGAQGAGLGLQGAKVASAESLENSGTTGQNAAGAAAAQYKICSEKADALLAAAKAADSATAALVPVPDKIQACTSAFKGTLNPAFKALSTAVAKRKEYCGKSMWDSIKTAASSSTVQMAGAALLGGAVVGGVTAAVMSGKGEKGGGDSTSTPSNVDVPTPTGNTVACGPGQYQVSPGVCAFGTSTQTNDPTKTAGGNAGNAENLGGDTSSAAGGGSAATAGGSASGVGSSTSSGSGSGASGSGSSSGGGSSRALTDSNASNRAEGSGLGYGGMGSYGGYSSGEQNGQNVAAAVVTEVFIDGTDDRGSYIYKLLNGKRVKVYVNCKTKSRCKIRNELKKRIEADPLLQ